MNRNRIKKIIDGLSCVFVRVCVSGNCGICFESAAPLSNWMPYLSHILSTCCSKYHPYYCQPNEVSWNNETKEHCLLTQEKRSQINMIGYWHFDIASKIVFSFFGVCAFCCCSIFDVCTGGRPKLDVRMERGKSGSKRAASGEKKCSTGTKLLLRFYGREWTIELCVCVLCVKSCGCHNLN